MTVYEIVTEKILKQLKQGIVPWQKPWHGKGAFNRVTRKYYSFLNQMILDHTGEYATLKQWNLVGGSIKKGEHGEQVVFWHVMQKEATTDDGSTEKKSIPVLRYYTVFHISQVEGVKSLTHTADESAVPVGNAEKIKKDYETREHITIYEEYSDKAYYDPLSDYIHIPEIAQYSNAAEYYSTCFHEMVHSTGYSGRLDRNLLKNAAFGSEEYSKEELIAEIGSANLCEIAGLDTEKSFKNSVAYIYSWIRALENDSRMIVSAAGKAEKAVKYILGENIEA
jgi:antirestriction protein ArdC